MNCSVYPAGPAGVSKFSVWDELVLVPSDFCPFYFADMGGSFAGAPGPANRVKITASAATTIRSAAGTFFSGIAGSRVVLRLVSSSGDAANATCVNWGTCDFDLPDGVTIPAGGYATLEGFAEAKPAGTYNYVSWPFIQIARLSETNRQVVICLPVPALAAQRSQPGLLSGSAISLATTACSPHPA